uniref:Uncharacterized protein n=1 Tax=Anguilla anguilla TaxID=7936 RepID=A0A0E9WM50_ANGAN
MGTQCRKCQGGESNPRLHRELVYRLTINQPTDCATWFPTFSFLFIKSLKHFNHISIFLITPSEKKASTH